MQLRKESLKKVAQITAMIFLQIIAGSLPIFLKISLGVMGVDSSITRFYCSSLTEKRKAVSILTLAEKAGMSTGIVTTTRVTHATPGCAYAHTSDRNWESDADIKERAKDDGSKCKDIGIV